MCVFHFQDKAQSLEHSMSVVLHAFEEEKLSIQEEHSVQLQKTCLELSLIKRQYELQKKEISRVKRLAKFVLQERCDIEQFFLEALSEVRKEILTNRFVYCLLYVCNIHGNIILL